MNFYNEAEVVQRFKLLKKEDFAREATRSSFVCFVFGTQMMIRYTEEKCFLELMKSSYRTCYRKCDATSLEHAPFVCCSQFQKPSMIYKESPLMSKPLVLCCVVYLSRFYLYFLTLSHIKTLPL